jgi:hypothetical protein
MASPDIESPVTPDDIRNTLNEGPFLSTLWDLIDCQFHGYISTYDVSLEEYIRTQLIRLEDGTLDIPTWTPYASMLEYIQSSLQTLLSTAEPHSD